MFTAVKKPAYAGFFLWSSNVRNQGQTSHEQQCGVAKAACRGCRPGYSSRCGPGQGVALAGLKNIGCRGAYGVPGAVHALAVWAVLTGKRLAVMREGWPGARPRGCEGEGIELEHRRCAGGRWRQAQQLQGVVHHVHGIAKCGQVRLRKRSWPVGMWATPGGQRNQEGEGQRYAQAWRI